MSQQEALLRERLREAAFVLRELRLERDALVKERTEPIAIVGIGCRFPGGANSPLAYWDLLAAGRDAVVKMEPRWKLVGAHPAEPVPRWAGLLTQAVETFDPGFFGISPREARALDPQQRLLLEVSWEALEDAGIVPLSLKQSRTGVFIAACANDYADSCARVPPAEQDAYLTTGNMLSIAAGRLSYTLGLQGPCLTLDTACSSSLVAIHLACRSLRVRESELALAGGVSLILSPDSTTALWRTQALSPDGRCRTFDALANGYVRGEGCGLVVLKRLRDAQRDGDRIWAVLRGSAINHDGRSTGLTAPNVLAQESLLRAALKDAGVEPAAIGYVETHGTGTSLGDPIEVEALRAVLGKPRADGGRCVLGAVKTNIGHLEGAAGVAGVIKAALALAQEQIPKNLNFRTLNAHIELANSSLDLATEPRAWPRGEKPRFAGVSSFGLSGTNAHVILEEAPAAARSDSAAVPAVPVLLSGRSEAALGAQAAQLGAHLTAHRDESLLDLAYTLACRRTQFEHRASIVVKSREQLHAALSALAQGQPSALVRTAAARSAGKLAFLFTGQGSQRPAMGRALAEGFPQFRDALDAVLAALDPLLPRPLREVLFTEQGTPQAQLLDQTGYTQPALFALQVALFRFLESLGITPDFLLGHSVGEIAAAHVAGVLALADACRLVAARGRLMQELADGGAMVALQAAEQEVKPLLVGKESLLDIAAINGPQHTVLSGDEEAVLEVARYFESRGRKCTRLSVSHGFHSPRMDAMAEAFGKVVAGLSYNKPQIPLISSVTGELATDGELSRPEYWVKQARATVQFQRGMATLDAAGVRSYLELGPRGVLCAMGAECLSEAAAQQSELVAVLRGEEPEPTALMQALGRLHVRGVRVDFDALLRPMNARRVALPTYPFQRQRCWIDAPRRGGLDVSTVAPAAGEHPLLGTVTSLGEQDSYLFAGLLSASISPWLLEHSIFSTAIFPGTGFLDLALCAAQTLELQAVAELVLSAPLTLSDSPAVQLQLLVQAPDAQGKRRFTISSQAAGAPLQAPWLHHGTGVLGASPKAAELDAPAQWPPDGAEPVDLSGLYTAFGARGLGYGPAYQGLRAVWRTADAVYVHARLPDALHTDGARFSVHPALLDTTLHGLAAALPVDAVDAAVMLVAWQSVRLFAKGASELRARLDLPTPRGGEQLSTSLVAWNELGQLVLVVEQVTLQRVRAAQLLAARSRQPLYAVQWMPVPAPASLAPAKEIWVLGGASGISGAMLAGPMELDERLRSATPPAQLVIDATQPVPQFALLAAHARTYEVLRVLQMWLNDARLAAVELVILTSGAVSTALDEDLPALDQAPLWGLVRSARSEDPDRRLRLLDLEAGSEPAAILGALAAEGEPELALRSGVLCAPRLVSLRPNDQTLSACIKAPLPRLAQGTVLITGGTGELATLLARHLVARYSARNLLLLSRRGMQAKGAAQLARELAEHQAAVRIVSCDVSEPQALAAVLQSIPDAAPLRAVFHCAAVLDDGVVSTQSAERIDRVFAPKLDAAWHLHTLTQSLDLDAFVLFSSVAGILGVPGQANYAAASTFLDALAAHRRHRGLPGQSLAWGLWQPHGQGLAAKLTAADLARLQQQGFGMFSAEEGLESLDAALARPEPLLVPMRLYGERLRARPDLVPPLLRAIAGPARTRATNPDAAGASQLPARLRALPADQRFGEVLELVRREVASILGLENGAALTPLQSLRDLGLDSLMAVELRNRVQALLAVRFELSAIWRLANLQEFAMELVRLLAPQTATSEFAGAPAEKPSPAGRPRLAPMSAGQQRLYFLDRVLELRHTYNLALSIRLPTALDVALLRSAVELLIARHEQLRVCFVEQDSQPRQRILPWVEPPLEELSLTVAEDTRDAALRQLVEMECQKPFELSRAPLFRLLYIRLGQAESALALLWHHIATDGSSMSIFVAELSAAYQTLHGGGQPELAAGPSYALYAARQLEWLQTDACNAQRDFWKAKLEGLPALELPTDRPAARRRTERGGLVKFTILAQTGAALEALVKRTRSTPFVILSAAWSALLSRYSGQQDFAIGTTMAGRHDDTVRDAVGFFVNTLPLRCQLHGEPTGLEYIKRLHAEIWSALEHQELPLDEIVRAVAPDRPPGFIGSPLFRTCVSYNEARASSGSFAGFPVDLVVDPVIEKVGGTSKFDLLLSMFALPQGFAAAIEFSTDLFDVATVERYAQHYLTLLTSLVEQPERRIHELPLLTAAERHQLLLTWNATDADYPRDACLHELFESQVERTPDAVALVQEEAQLSYRALNAKANQLAHRLRALSVGPEVFVALFVERSFDMVVAILGILKAGGAYVPIDPDSPADRIDFMLQDTRPAVLLTQRELVEKLPRTSVPIFCLDDPVTFAGQTVDNLKPLSRSANLAYVIYTSGSTGRPKGVLIEQRSVSNLLQALNRRAWGPAPRRVAMLAPIFFDMSVKPLFGSLLYGHTLYIVDKQTRRDGGALLSFFQRHAIAWSDCTPSILAMLVDAGLPSCQPLALQVLLCGGEALSAALVASVYAPQIRSTLQIINVYGPTETCVNVNANPVTAQTLDLSRAVVPMGRPFENTQLYILDAHLQPVPVGVPGELHIGGVGLARGYLNRPDLTAEKFIPNPFATDLGSRLYKTGDLVRFLADGKIEFLGRIDHQVKLRGYRIELGEIEAVLASHSDIASCVVMAREDKPEEKYLVAYVVLQPGHSLPAEALRAHLAKQLPDYMLPAAFVFLAALPLNRNGKVDRRALPAPARERGESSFVPPANPLEGALADIFSSVLKRQRIGRHDDFFAMGGDSLLAVRAVTRAQQAGFALTVNQLFRSPTLAKLYAGMVGTSRPSCLTMLQEGQKPGGVVFVPGAGGVFHRAHDIVRALAVSTPSFGLISPIIAGLKERPGSVVELAALYAQDIVWRIPQGPLVLIGYSFGGPVALAITETLLTMNRAVERVILLDARPSAKDAPQELDAQTTLVALLDTLGIPASRIQSSGHADPLAALAALLAPDAEQAPGLRSFIGSVLESAQGAAKMFAAWQPRLPNVPVHLLRVAGHEERGADYGWSLYGSLASVQTIPGQHYSILRPPYLASTMQAVRSLLDSSLAT